MLETTGDLGLGTPAHGQINPLVNSKTDLLLIGTPGAVTLIGIFHQQTTVYSRTVILETTQSHQANLFWYGIPWAMILIKVDHLETMTYGRTTPETERCQTAHQANLLHIRTLGSMALVHANHLVYIPHPLAHIHFWVHAFLLTEG